MKIDYVIIVLIKILFLLYHTSSSSCCMFLTKYQKYSYSHCYENVQSYLKFYPF